MVWHLWGWLAGAAQRLRRRLGDVGATAVLVALAGALAPGSLADPAPMRPGTVLAVPVLLGGLSLPLRAFRLLVLACLLLGVLVAVARGLWVFSVGSAPVFLRARPFAYDQVRRT